MLKEDCPTNRILEKTHITAYPVLIITDVKWMRGTDFRAPSKGLNLYIDANFDYSRDYSQALCRVGRQNDPYEIFQTVNFTKTFAHQSALLKKMKEFVLDFKASSPSKASTAKHKTKSVSKAEVEEVKIPTSD